MRWSDTSDHLLQVVLFCVLLLSTHVSPLLTSCGRIDYGKGECKKQVHRLWANPNYCIRGHCLDVTITRPKLMKTLNLTQMTFSAHLNRSNECLLDRQTVTFTSASKPFFAAKLNLPCAGDNLYLSVSC